MTRKTIPYKTICDSVFKSNLLPAVYRWISNLSPEELARFNTVFPALANDDVEARGVSTRHLGTRLQASRYTIPEWPVFGAGLPNSAPRSGPMTPDDWLKRPTSSHLCYGAFDEAQMRQAKPALARTRASERSQVNIGTTSKAYMQSWNDRVMNTTYRHDYCHCGFDRTLQRQTPDQTVIVYSKNTLNADATERAKRHIDRDPIWTRNFRELCRSLNDAIEATAYREGYTTMKEAPGERFTHPRWRDPVPVSVGLKKPAEAYWASTYRHDFSPLTRIRDTVPYDDQHRARYSKPFDNHPMTEKTTTTFRTEFVDHMANKEEQPDYWTDMVVRIPPGTAVVGNIEGAGPPPV